MPEGKLNPQGYRGPGREVLEEILTNPDTTVSRDFGAYHGEKGPLVRLQVPHGPGVRYTPDGEFVGFVPWKEEP